MIEKLESIIEKYNSLSDLLSDPDVISNPKKFAKIAKEHNGLIEIVEKSKKYIDVSQQLASANEMLDSEEEEFVLLAKEEISIIQFIF